MPEYRIKVSISVVPYDKPYSPSLESSYHDFFVEADDAVTATKMARVDLFSVLYPLVTVDKHDRLKAEAAEAAEQ